MESIRIKLGQCELSVDRIVGVPAESSSSGNISASSETGLSPSPSPAPSHAQ